MALVRAGLVRARMALAVGARSLAFSSKSEANPASAANEALEAAISQVEKNHGAGTVMRLGSASESIRNCSVIPTGSLQLDAILGVGGLPRGRVCEIYGPEASGKTTDEIAATCERNTWLDAGEMLEYGIVDRVLDSMPIPGADA